MADRIRQRLGNYRLVRLLGRGGFADVYLGEHIHLDMYAAIKVLHSQISSSDSDKFRAEARTISKLMHPNIVRILDFGVDGETPFLVMDYAPGGTLHERLPRGTPLPLAIIVSCVKQIAEALQYAHSKKIVHRDIKPGNMLVGKRNEILLSDFGIFVVAHNTATITPQQPIGTPYYMAPEQIEGKAHLASDQYALGIVVYEWLCGTVPFQIGDISYQHLHVPPPPLSIKVPSIPPQVEQIVMKALAKNPKERYECVQDFANALEQAYNKTTRPLGFISSADKNPASPLEHLQQEQQGVTEEKHPFQRKVAHTEPTFLSRVRDFLSSSNLSSLCSNLYNSVSYQVTRWFERLQPSLQPRYPHDVLLQRYSRRKLVAAGLVVLGLATAGATVLLALSQESSPQLALGTSLYIYKSHTKAVNAVAWAPDGKRIASGSDDKTVKVWDAISGKTFATSEDEDLSGTIDSLAWASDNKRIAFGSGDKMVKVWDSTSRNILATCIGHTDTVLTVAWSPNNRFVASGSKDTTMRVWNSTSGKQLRIYKTHRDSIYTVTWSPDSNFIASVGADGTIEVLNVTTNATILAYQGDAQFVYAAAWSPDSSYLVSGGSDSIVKMWNASSSHLILTCEGHTGPVYTVAWSPDGKYIASGSKDKTVKVWNATNGQEVFTYRGHIDSVGDVSWSPDSKLIASAGGDKDKTVHVWQAAN